MKKNYPLWQQVKQIVYKDKCLWNGCQNACINSHSQTKKNLAIIAVENKVYGINKDPIKLHKGEIFKEKNVKEASIFYGFCPQHDNDLFEYIEKKSLSGIDHKSAFLFFTRSVFFEYFQKKTSALKMKKFFKLLEGKNQLNNEFLAKDFLMGFDQFNQVEFPIYEHEIYNIFQNKKYDNINFLYKLIPIKIDLSLSTLINPLFDEYIPVPNIEQPIFSLNIVPYETKCFIILSWHKKYDGYMSFIKDEFENNFNKLLNFLCFYESEDFYCSLKFFNQYIHRNLNHFKKIIFNRFNAPYQFPYDETKIVYKFLN